MDNVVKRLIPELRFPEFDGDWDLKPLIEIADGKLSNGVFNDPKKVGSGYYLINVKDMYSDLKINKNNLTRLELSEQVFNKNKVKFGDIFFTRSSLVKEGIAYSAINLTNDEDITYDGHLIKLSPDLSENVPLFLGYLLKTLFVRKQIIARGKTGTMTTIGQQDLVSVKLPVSRKKEQQKIANFLTAVDHRISLLKQKKAALETYKKGLMQKIFSQEIRFKDDDGEDYPDWEEKKLEEICEVKGGKRLPKGYLLQKENNGFSYITVSDMDNGSVDLSGIKYIPSAVVDKIKNYRISTSDIYVSVAGTLGLTGIIPKELDGANLTENANKLTNIKCSQAYLFHYLKSTYFFKLISSVKTTNAQPKLAIYALKSFKVNLPEIEEQQKIADCLSSMDQSINKLTKQIEQTTQFKKGLLQRMFV